MPEALLAALAGALRLQLMAVALEQGGDAIGHQAHARPVAHVLMHDKPESLAIQIVDRRGQLQQRWLFRSEEGQLFRSAGPEAGPAFERPFVGRT